jgi:hypothetical protein
MAPGRQFQRLESFHRIASFQPLETIIPFNAGSAYELQNPDELSNGCKAALIDNFAVYRIQTNKRKNSQNGANDGKN